MSCFCYALYITPVVALECKTADVFSFYNKITDQKIRN